MKQDSLNHCNVAKKENAFISTGFSKWKDALSDFRKHQSSECHSVSMTYEYVVPKCGNAREMNNETIKTSMVENRKCFMKILESLRYLSRQNIAIQGKTDAESNFMQLLMLRAIDFRPLKRWLKNMNDTYTSHPIQNEILNLLSHDVIRSLVRDIKGGQCSYFSLISDEYTDIANNEQLTICLRWIDKNMDAQEDFIGFYEIPNIKATTIESVIKDALIRLQLSLDDCRGQCYDGASNMLGKKSGVATRIKNIQPKAIDTHCHCHSLSLSVKDATKGSKVLTIAMDYSKEIVLLIKLSPKRENILGEVKDNLEGEMEYVTDTPGLAKFSATRWTVRSGCFNRIYLNYAALQKVWDECLVSGGLSVEIKARIIGCQSQMRSFDFFFGLLLGERLFAHSDNLSKTLQGKKISAVVGHRVAMLMVDTLLRIRNDTSFDLFYESVLSKKSDLDVRDPELSQRKKIPSRFSSGTTPHEFSSAKDVYRKYYFEAIDLLTGHVKERFNQPSFKIFMKLEALLLDSLVKEMSELEKDSMIIKEIYGDDVNLDKLLTQLELFKTLAKNSDLSTFSDILGLVKTLSGGEKSSISEVITVINLLNVNPASSSTGERSFSCARRVLTWQRSTMEQDRFNSLAILNTHKDRTDSLDLIRVANNFVTNDNRKRHFGTFTTLDLE